MRLKLHWRIAPAMLLATAAGIGSGTTGGIFGVPFCAAYDFPGTLFFNALKMLIAPLQPVSRPAPAPTM